MKYTILDYLEQTTQRFPENTAFADLNSKVTWKEFTQKAKEYSTVIEKYYEAGKPVAFMMEKSVSTLEWFFAALYAGCFYSYFDSTFPAPRLNSMVKTLDVKYIITEEKNLPKFQGAQAIETAKPLLVTDLEKEVCEYSDSRRKNIIDSDIVYANFTSGTTGNPKAVVVNHKNVIDFISCFTEIFELDEHTILANQAPFDFDVSVKDIFSAVFTGAQVHLVPKMYFSFPTKLLDFLEERKVNTIIWAVSAVCIISTLGGFKYKIPSTLKKIMFSGEVMPIKQMKIWQENLPDAQYINLYGPTEITCNCSYYKIPGKITDDCTDIPIGIPFPNERIILLDDDGKQVLKAGEEGELCVSGTCVVPGYYNNREKTDSVFVQNPLEVSRFDRIYKTGDLAKYDEKGLLHYIGRKDTQIKHMGHRIELGEIEGAIEKNPAISRACCIFSSNKITAFYTGKETDKKELISELKISLPVYMVPSAFKFIDAFPLTKNGKIDKRALEASLAK